MHLKSTKFYLLFLAIFFISSVTANSQRDYDKNRFTAGIVAGGGISSFTTSIEPDGLGGKEACFNGGLALMIPITEKRFSLTTEFTYALKFYSDAFNNEVMYEHEFLEWPVMLNVRLFSRQRHYKYQILNFELGLGVSKGLSSRANYDSSEPVPNMPSGWYQYAQTHSGFEPLRSYNGFFVIGTNFHYVGNHIQSIGVRYCRTFNSLYARNDVTQYYDFTTKAHSITLQLYFYL